MTTINDISDLIRIIRQDPDWAEALRSVLLSKELLALPETFAAFVSENPGRTHAWLTNACTPWRPKLPTSPAWEET